MKIIAEYLLSFVIKTITFLIIGFIANLFFELIGIPFNLVSNASSYNELYTKKPEIFDVEKNNYKSEFFTQIQVEQFFKYFFYFYSYTKISKTKRV